MHTKISIKLNTAFYLLTTTVLFQQAAISLYISRSHTITEIENYLHVQAQTATPSRSRNILNNVNIPLPFKPLRISTKCIIENNVTIKNLNENKVNNNQIMQNIQF